MASPGDNHLFDCVVTATSNGPFVAAKQTGKHIAHRVLAIPFLEEQYPILARLKEQ